MWSETIIKKILDEYKLPNYNGSISWLNFPGYPHVVEVRFAEDIFYLKEIIVNKIKKEWMENIYASLDKDNFYVHPFRNIYDNYLTDMYLEDLTENHSNESECCYLLTRKMEKVSDTPSVQWWVNCLAPIHKKIIVANENRETLEQIEKGEWGKCIILPDYSETIRRMNRVYDIMEQDVKNLINSLLICNQDANVRSKKGVPVHGDPLRSNVARDNNIMTLYDFESSGLSVPEYDIQRLFADVATNCRDFQEIDKFVFEYCDAYEDKGIKIDKDILDYLFRLDLIKTICWLYEMSVSYNRQDHERQNYELEKYKAALRGGCYHRVISAIHGTWQYDLKSIKINNQEEIVYVAKLISAIVPDFLCVTLGGSRSHFLDDGVSDVEMYFYSKTAIPSIEDINRVLCNAGAIHRRSSSFLWNEAPWGPHSFFEIKGLYFEIGYRILDDTKEKIKNYLSGRIVEPQKDCHDLGLGYLFSGLAASVQAEKIILCNDQEFFKLKEMVNQFPDDLKKALREEYMDTAENLIRGKLYVAAQRQDVFFYNVLSTRVIRCLMVMAFSLTNTHFPGDKWNEVLLLHTRWSESKRVLQLLNSHMRMDASCIEKYDLLLETYNIIKNCLLNQ